MPDPMLNAADDHGTAGTARSEMAESASGIARYPTTPLLTKERWHPDGLYRDDGVVLMRRA